MSIHWCKRLITSSAFFSAESHLIEHKKYRLRIERDENQNLPVFAFPSLFFSFFFIVIAECFALFSSFLSFPMAKMSVCHTKVFMILRKLIAQPLRRNSVIASHFSIVFVMRTCRNRRLELRGLTEYGIHVLCYELYSISKRTNKIPYEAIFAKL